MKYSLPVILAALWASACLPAAAAASAKRLLGECPGTYRVKPGLNVDFPSDGTKRAFVVVPPTRLGKVAPVWVPLTGTVESTNDNLHVARSGANALMAEQGFMVIGPVRESADQNPDLRAGACNGPGIDGWNWRPWTEGRAAGAAGDSSSLQLLQFHPGCGCGVMLRQSRTHVAPAQHSGLQSLGAHDTGCLSERKPQQRLPPDIPARRISLPRGSIYRSLLNT